MRIEIELPEYDGTSETNKHLNLTPVFSGKVRLEIVRDESFSDGYITLNICELQKALNKLAL